MMNENESYPLLQEYPLESNFLELIPARAQRGLSTFDLEFTCIDADGPYIALGSNVGVVYLINRELADLKKLKDVDHKNDVSSVKVLVSVECLVAVGYKDGAVLVYKVPFSKNKVLEKFTVEGLHSNSCELEKFTVEGLHSSSVTSLEWAKNGMKFFSGDENGVVICTEIDHFEHQSRSRILLDERIKIIQLSYSHLNLVVSTLFRSLIYSLETNSISQIGQKERKCFGPFGAIILEDDDQSCAIYASRPGQRLWKSDLSGTIQETLIFKSALCESKPSIQLLAKLDESISFTDFQFERLARYQSSILIWCEIYLILIDPKQKIILATSPKLDPIVGVATCKKEIFILRGMRHIVRISTNPDNYSKKVEKPDEPSLLEDILVPFKELSTYVKERSDSLSVQSESNPTIFSWLKKKRTASSSADFSDGVVGSKEASLDISEPLPEIVNLNPNDCTPVKIDELSTSVIYTPELLTKDFSDANENDDIVYKVKKKHKKQKKVQFMIDAAPKREKYKFKPSIDSKNVSNSEAIQHINLNVNKENNMQLTNPNVPIEQNANSASNLSNVNILKSSKVLLGYDQTDSKINHKSDVDGDKLLENVLSVYSHLKQKDNSSNLNSSSEIVYDNSESIVNHNEKDKDFVIDDIKNIDNHNCSSQDIVKPDLYNLDNQVVDADEVYLPHPSLELEKLPNSEDSIESMSFDESSSCSFENKCNDPPKYGVDWVEYKAPELLLDLSVSNDHIFCVDVRNKLYFTKHPQMGSLSWIELEQPAEKVAASNLENVVWVLYYGTVYAAVHKAHYLWENTEWVSIARDVVSIAVDNECGWYAKSNGELVTQQNLSLTKPYNYPETVPCNSPALKVAVKDNVLWVLTVSGSLLSKKHIGGKNSVWKEIILKNIPDIDNIFLGSMKTGWIVDTNGMIHFIFGVTPENPEGTGEPWLVEASSYLLRPTTQLEHVVRRALNSEVLTNLIRGKQHLCLSASDIGVWFCKTYENLLYSNQKSIIGHMWELVIPPTTAVSTKWRLIAADGIQNSEGVLWCVSSAEEIFCYCVKLQQLLPVESPSSSGIACLQAKYQSLWLLSEEGDIYIRRGITPSCLQGIWWQALDLLQFGGQQITHISCSSFVSWACTIDGEIYMRLGSLSPSSNKLNQAWLSIGHEKENATMPLVKLSAIGKHFPLPLIPTHFSEEIFAKVYVGPLGYPVWAVDNKGNVFAREGVTTNLPIGEKWTSIPDLRAKELCISNNAVWLLKRSGKIYRRFGISEKNPCGDYWKQIPGKLDYLTATEDDDIWGLLNNSMFCHYSFVLYSAMSNTLEKKSVEHIISEEEDWEDIMADDFDHD